MKNLVSFFVALTFAATAFGQAQTDLLLSLKMQQASSKQKTKVKSKSSSETINVIADVQESAISEVNSFAKVTAYAGGVAVINIPVNALKRLCNIEGVKYISSSKPMHLCMDKARAMGKVDQVHQGIGLPQGYDGTGVVFGLLDVGFDPNHAAFTDERGKSRVKAFIQTDTLTQEPVIITSPEEISSIKTDYSNKYHGTHTASIGAGRNFNNNFGGVASGADIVMSTCDDLPVFSQEMVKLMKNMGKPYVLSISLGNNFGAHDGTDLESRFFGELAKDNIICISAGNEGDIELAMTHKFNGSESAYALCALTPNYVQVWGDTSKPFKCEVMLCNKYNGEIVPFCSFDQANEQKTLNSDDNTPIGSKLRELFNNNPVELSAGTYVNVLNNRYCVELYCDMDVDDDIIYDLFKRGYFILLKMTGEGGQVINGFKDEYSPFFSVEDMISSGYITDGMTAELSTNGTINSFCINDDVISVGACYSRREEGYMEEEGNVADFSSWCDFAGSYRKPHLLAPGSYIYAASNRYYSNADDKLQYITVDGKEYPYKGAAGTSMSAPFAAGTIALWLQANPELKPHDVLDIINKTCVKNEYYEKDENKARWGAGIIDAYAGIKEALSRPTNIVDVTANKAIPLVKLLDNKMLEVTVAAGSPCNVKIYSVDGRIVNTASSKENNITIPLTSLTGTYIVNVNGKSMKMVIK